MRKLLSIFFLSSLSLAQSISGGGRISAINTPQNPPLVLTSSAPPNGTQGGAYNFPITATGGTLPYTCTVDSGGPPTGVNLTGCSLIGTLGAAGSFNIVIRITDALGQFILAPATSFYTITVTSQVPGAFMVASGGDNTHGCTFLLPCNGDAAGFSMAKSVVVTLPVGQKTVQLHGGTYSLAATLAFGAGDSGTGTSDRIVWENYPGENALITGLKQVTGFNGNANIDDAPPNSVVGGVGWKAVCVLPSCNPGGVNPPAATSQVNSGGGTVFSITSPAGGNSNALWTYVTGPNESSTNYTSDFKVTPSANSALAGSFEFDDFLFSTVQNIEFMFGHQCNQGSGLWQVFDQLHNSWVDTSIACAIPPSVQTHIQFFEHRVSGDTNGCGGKPCQYYDGVSVNGVYQSFGPIVLGSSTLPVGWASTAGWQIQLDIPGANTTVTEKLDSAYFIAGTSCGVNCQRYTATLPAASWPNFESLWYNGVRRPRPTSAGATPLHGYAPNACPTSLTNDPFLCVNAASQALASQACGCPVGQTCAGLQTKVCSGTPGGAGTPYQCFNKYKYLASDINGSWHGIGVGDVEVEIFENWTMARMRLKTAAAGQATFFGPTAQSDLHGCQGGHSYLVENVKENVHAGTWYLDRDADNNGVLDVNQTLEIDADTSIGENPLTADVEVPHLSAASPSILTGNSTNFVTFQSHPSGGSLTFSGDNWQPDFALSLGDQQGSPNVTGALSFIAGNSLTFDHITVKQTTGMGLDFEGSQFLTTANNVVQNSDFKDIGALSIRIETGITGQVAAQPNDTNLNVPNHYLVQNILCDHPQRIVPTGYGPCVFLGDGHDNTFTHNESAYGYTGGFELGFGLKRGADDGSTVNQFFTYNNTVSFNHIYGAPNAVMSDFAGIYIASSESTLCPAGTPLTGNPCNSILNNYIHDMYSNYDLSSAAVSSGARGIYGDQGHSKLLIKNNLVTRTGHSSIFINQPQISGPNHYADQNDLIDNNILLSCGYQNGNFTANLNEGIIARNGSGANALTWQHNIGACAINSALSNVNFQNLAGSWACFGVFFAQYNGAGTSTIQIIGTPATSVVIVDGTGTHTFSTAGQTLAQIATSIKGISASYQAGTTSDIGSVAASGLVAVGPVSIAKTLFSDGSFASACTNHFTFKNSDWFDYTSPNPVGFGTCASIACASPFNGSNYHQFQLTPGNGTLPANWTQTWTADNLHAGEDSGSVAVDPQFNNPTCTAAGGFNADDYHYSHSFAAQGITVFDYTQAGRTSNLFSVDQTIPDLFPQRAVDCTKDFGSVTPTPGVFTGTGFVAAPVPPFSGSSGIGQTGVDSNLPPSHTIFRCTDSTTNASNTFQTSDSGEQGIWSSDDALLAVRNSFGSSFIELFDPLDGAHQYCYISNIKFTTASVAFSSVNPRLLYVKGHVDPITFAYTDADEIDSVTIGVVGHVATISSAVKLFNFTSDSVNCLDSSYSNPTWTGTFTIAQDDSSFTLGFSNSGAQGTGCSVTNYTVGKGCRVWNTCTGAVTGDWGSLGTISEGDRFKLHEASQQDPSGFAFASTTPPTGCISGNCTNGNIGPYVWNIPTLSAPSCFEVNVPGGQTGTCSGHSAKGGLHDLIGKTYKSHLFSDMTQELIPQINTLVPDQHGTWNNSGVNDLNIFFLDTGTVDPTCSGLYLNPTSIPYFSEVIGATPMFIAHTPVVGRYTHTWSSGCNSNFIVANGIGTVSQTGNFLAFTSDMIGGLGNDHGTGLTCQMGGLPNVTTQWVTAHAYSLNNQVNPNTNNTGKFDFRVTTAGTSGGVQPNWNSVPGLNATITDGTVVWTNFGIACRGDVFILKIN